MNKHTVYFTNMLGFSHQDTFLQQYNKTSVLTTFKLLQDWVSLCDINIFNILHFTNLYIKIEKIVQNHCAYVI